MKKQAYACFIIGFQTAFLTMRKKIVYWIKQVAQTLVMVALLAFAVDWYRRPVQPAGMANAPLHTLSGQHTSLAELSDGQTVAVYFWGSWCGICRYTSPVVNRLHQAGVPVLGVALRSGSPQEVGVYMQRQQLHFDNVNDERGVLSQQWQVQVTPTVALVKNGRLIHSTSGVSSYWGLRSRIWLADQWY